MYYLFLVVLEHCPYSNISLEIVKKNNINFKSLKIIQSEKEKYKTKEISTFPQIYLKKYGRNDSLLLGGCSDLEYFLNTFKNKEYNIKKVEEFQQKYSSWNKHSTLRLIELINIK
jgi:glutaredoxin-related protein